MQVVEAALGLLPFSEKTITTPTGQEQQQLAAALHQQLFISCIRPAPVQNLAAGHMRVGYGSPKSYPNIVACTVYLCCCLQATPTLAWILPASCAACPSFAVVSVFILYPTAWLCRVVVSIQEAGLCGHDMPGTWEYGISAASAFRALLLSMCTWTVSQAPFILVAAAGESMEAALRTCCKGIKIGKILVVRHHGQMSRAGTNAPSPAPNSALTTPNQASSSAAADGPFNSPRQNQQWQQHNAAVAAYSGSSSQPVSRPLSALSAAGAAAVQDASSNGSSSIPKPSETRFSPRGSPIGPGGYSTEGGAFAAALAMHGGSVNNQCWFQHSTQDVIYEKLPADIAERHVLLMDPVLSTGNSAYTAIEVRAGRHVAYAHARNTHLFPGRVMHTPAAVVWLKPKWKTQ